MENSTDVTKFVLNCIPSRNRDSMWSHEAALEAGLVPKVSAAQIPSSVDLRNAKNWPVRHQGSTGACVGFATADGLLRYHYAKKGLIPSIATQTAPRFIWMADKETDQITDYPTTFIESAGTQVGNALNIAQRYGCVLESDLPMSGSLWQGRSEAFYAKAATLRIASYHSLGTNLVVWKKWLSSNGPILTRLGVDATWDNATATKGVLGKYQPNTVRGGHAVCIVGYNSQGFIVRNSWGENWGDKGFAYASQDYTLATFAAPGGEAYGVVL